ncbi:hypothetical protein [Nonomuraea turkmeniaca]|uniref:hypothetical protein n=1 Tax=Nonomuraea turkmeniaca TaxID=103838 RepID=UPI0014771019|nr:hypothetical protein [Nonomuraea turkmeniaca]
MTAEAGGGEPTPDLALFEGPEPITPPRESAGRSLTRRQRELLAAGQHPLSLALGRPLRLHPEAAPHEDRQARGRRCGTCVFRQTMSRRGHSYPKCSKGEGRRVSHGAATDCRSWWPGCSDHEEADNSTSN